MKASARVVVRRAIPGSGTAMMVTRFLSSHPSYPSWRSSMHWDRVFWTSGTVLFALALAGHALAVELSPTSPRARAAAEEAAADPARSAAAPTSPNRLIIKFREGTQARSADAVAPEISTTIAGQGAARVESITPAAGSAQVLTLDRPVSEQELQNIMETIRSNPNVEYVEP